MQTKYNQKSYSITFNEFKRFYNILIQYVGLKDQNNQKSRPNNIFTANFANVFINYNISFSYYIFKISQF